MISRWLHIFAPFDDDLNCKNVEFLIQKPQTELCGLNAKDIHYASRSKDCSFKIQ